MKRIPAGLIFATVFLLAIPTEIRAEDESASDLAAQQELNPGDSDDESAAQLATQDGDAVKDGSDGEESAKQLAGQSGLNPGDSDDESAAQLATQDGDAVKDGADDDESAAALAEGKKLENKPKVTKSAPDGSTYAAGDGVDGTVYAAAAQPDGKVVIGGNFNNVDGQPRSNVARINADGSLDMTFLADEEHGVDGAVYAVAVDGKGNIWVGGDFSQPRHSEIKNLIRYTKAGKVDTTFDGTSCPNGTVYAISVQADGSVVVGGEFSEVGPAERRNLAKFKPDDTLAGAFNVPEGVSGTVRALVEQPASKVFAGGIFDDGGDAARNVISVSAK